MDNPSPVRKSEKFFFALANLGNIPIMTIITTYLLIYYTTVIGLDPAAVSTLFIIARFADALNDPIIGFLLDRFPVTRMGRFRPILLVGSILGGLNFLLLWYGPLMVTAGKLAIVYVSYLLLGITFTIMDISLNSLLPVMTQNPKERNTLSGIKGVTSMMGALVISIFAPMVIGSMADQAQGYMLLIGILTAMIILFSVVGSLGVRERVKKLSGEKYSVRDLFRIISQRPVLIAFVLALCYSLGSNIYGTVNAFFFTYLIGDLTLLGLMSLVSMAGVIPGSIVGAIIANKLGKKRVYIAGYILLTVGLLLRIISPTNIGLLIGCSIIFGIGQGFVTTLMYGIQADNTDYVEYATGKRAEAAVASLSSFVTKVGMGIGGAIPGYILATVGFSAAAVEQPATVTTAIIVTTLVVPTLFFAVGAVVFAALYKIDKPFLEKMNRKLTETRTKDSVESASS
ncbi:glycoside-pentoside-hexuronide (GPH):cation symporter [Ruminococcaceae bacterium OttesenSCG-928-A11]|nr:glycoside-pentoside-hexuronide (GPH):cation symporter [Ruminococcaceae bacterium OttesenSCG-928-A11]